MNRKRTLLLGLAIAVGLLATGTGSYTAVTDENALAVPVADDDGGPIQFESEAPPGLPNGRTNDVALLTITNRFGDGVMVTDVSVESGRGEPHARNTRISESRLSDQESTDIVADTVCGGPDTETFTVQVTVSANSGSFVVQKSVPVRIDCTGQTPTPASSGNGNGSGDGNGNGDSNGNGNSPS